MITKERVKTLITDMIEYTMHKDGYWDRKLDSLFNSGALDLEKYDDDYELPKIILCAMLKEMSYQYAPNSDAGRKEVKNIGLFF